MSESDFTFENLLRRIVKEEIRTILWRLKED